MQYIAQDKKPYTSAKGFGHRYQAHPDQHSILQQYGKEMMSGHTGRQHERPATAWSLIKRKFKITTS